MGVVTVRTEPHLLERDRELAELDASLAGVADLPGVFLLLEGPAGIGKTRLIQAAIRKATARGFTVLRARGSELENAFAFGVVRQLFEPWLERAGDPARNAAMRGAARSCAPLFGRVAEPWVRPTTSLRARRLHGLYWLCANLAIVAPVLIALDDVHWADEASLDFLAFLTRRLDELPVVVVASVRSDEGGAHEEHVRGLATDAATRLVRPLPLTVAAIDQLATDILATAPEAGFASVCHKATGGTPLLVLELIRTLAEARAEPTVAAVSRIERSGSEALVRSVTQRLNRLGAPATRVCEALAVLGDDAQLDYLAALAELEPDAAAVVIDVLTAAGILTTGAATSFVHPVIRGAADSSIPVARKERLHRRAAQLLAADGAAPEARGPPDAAATPGRPVARRRAVASRC